MKKLITLLLFVSISSGLFAHHIDTTHYKNGFAINFESLFAEDFKLSYTHRLTDKMYIEGMLSYNIPLSSTSNSNNMSVNSLVRNDVNGEDGLLQLRDPYYLYGRVQIRAGVKFYVSRRFYVCPEFLFNHGSFDHVDDIIYDRSSQNYYEVSRTKSDLEFLIKCGWTFQSHHFLRDFYSGWGVRFKSLNDQVYEESIGNGNYQTFIPYNYKTSYTLIEFHMGFQFGYCK